VQPLAEEDSRAFLDLLVVELQLSPSATVRRALLGAAAGFPLVLELLVRDWARSGPQCLALSLDAVTADAGRKSGPDEAYQLLLDRLARTLDAGTRNTLHVAAVLGPRLNDSGLYSLADLKVGEVMTGLTTLVQFRILRDGGDHLEFSNDLVRAHAYYAVPAPMRLLLHRLIADVLTVAGSRGGRLAGTRDRLGTACGAGGRRRRPNICSSGREPRLGAARCTRQSGGWNRVSAPSRGLPCRKPDYYSLSFCRSKAVSPNR
jgi:hypothetical protein